MDQALSKWIVRVRPQWLVDGAALITHGGTLGGCMVLLVLVAAARLRQGSVEARAATSRWLWCGASAMVATHLLVRLLKLVIDRDRPPLAWHAALADGQSMPSGHAANAACAAALIWAVVPRRWRWVAAIGAAAVGSTRVILGVHWPTDVAVGAALGGALGCLVARLSTRSARQLA